MTEMMMTVDGGVQFVKDVLTDGMIMKWTDG